MTVGLIRGTCLTLLVAAMALVGCQTEQKAQDDNAPKTRYAHGYPGEHPESHTKPTTVSVNEEKAAPAKTGMVSTAIAIPTGNRATSGMLIEKMAPAEVSVGQSYDYTIKVTNLTRQSLSEVTITDTIEGKFDLASSSPEGKRARGDLTWQLGSLAPGQSQTITLTGKATGEGTIENCVTGSYALAACLATNVTQPALDLTKTMDSQAMICDVINSQMIVTNNGTGDATNVMIVDELPEGLTTTDGMKTLKYKVGTLPAGESRKMTAQLKASKTGTFTNTANATADGGLEDSASAKVTVRQPVLTLKKTGTEKTYGGRDIEYTITVSNTGDGAAKDVKITDGVPATTSFVSATNGGRLAGDSVVWNLGTLEPGQSRKVSMTVKSSTLTTVNNSAAASAVCAEGVTARATTEVVGIPAILLEVVDRDGGVDYDPVEVGDNVVYVITATNQGSLKDMNIRITATPENADFVSASGATNGQFRNGTVEFAPLDELGPKREAMWKVTVKATEPGNVRFKVTMRTNELGDRPVEETEATNFYE